MARLGIKGDEPLAHLWTGVALEQGIGTTIDLIEAYKWYLVAFKYGQTGSSAAKKRAEAKLSTEQQVEARRRADEYKPIKTPQAETAAAAAKDALPARNDRRENRSPVARGNNGGWYDIGIRD